MGIDWTGAPEEAEAAIAQIEANAVGFNQIRELAKTIGVAMPRDIGKAALAELVVARLRGTRDTGGAPDPDPEDRPDPEDQDAKLASGPPAAAPAAAGQEAEMIIDEDLDEIRVFPAGEEDSRAVLMRRIGGLRGARQATLVRSARSQAEAAGYVVRRCLRRVLNTDYGV